MAKFDYEDLLDNVEKIFKAKLNAKLTEIENEKIAKGAGLPGGLKPIAETSYYRQTWSQKIYNSSPALFFGIIDVGATDGGPEVAKLVKIFVEVIYVDNGMDNNTDKRVSRYGRAVEEVAKENASKFGLTGQATIQVVTPVGWMVDVGSSEECKATGIQLTTSIV